MFIRFKGWSIIDRHFVRILVSKAGHRKLLPIKNNKSFSISRSNSNPHPNTISNTYKYTHRHPYNAKYSNLEYLSLHFFLHYDFWYIIPFHFR